MFMLHIAYALNFIALGIGVILLVWSIRNQGKGVLIAKIFGYIIIALSILSILCSTYYGIKYPMMGPHPGMCMMMSKMEGQPGMMGPGMMQHPMMQHHIMMHEHMMQHQGLQNQQHHQQ